MSLDGKEFKDVVGLGQVLHDHSSLPTCLVKRIYAYGTGGAPTEKDQPALAYLNALFAADGYRVPDLMRTIVLSAAFSEVYDNPEPSKQ